MIRFGPGRVIKVILDRGRLVEIEVEVDGAARRAISLPQLTGPVKVGDQTYYGCCKMCVGTLNKDRSARFATDQVSGKEVDKAKAVIGAKPNGEVLYFESEKNLQSFTLK